MLLIRELARLARDLIGFAVGARRVGVVLLIVSVAIVAMLTTAVTTLGPVSIYPFL